ncbi:glycosyltransferase family 1 protein [Vibrio sp. S9_S30]|uniref:glycosyltransferase n=1 Tax=Vibrio sp. S9_S30 TaxID=2720226 RepID=UPI0016814DFE|nr:glycosyltransferase [Vibrio sp. S9_S30]MBD1556208.1 glycosyltransferase family 1 protein [Vibrio sp. S9_S30]
MSIAIFSISDQYHKFHRRPFINAISDALALENVPLLYFKRPKWILKSDRGYLKEELVGNTRVLPLVTLLPISWTLNSKILRYLTVSLPIKWQVAKAGKKCGSKVSCLWFYKPDQYLYLNDLNIPYAYTHYDNYDGDAQYLFSKHKDYQYTLKQCVENSAVCFATSHRLVEKLSGMSEDTKVHYLPNAVSEAMISSFGAAKEPENVIGFVGSIDKSTDESLIEKVCMAYPNMTVRLIGTVNNPAISELAKRVDNLDLPGVVPYERLPAVLSSFRVGICPYRSSPFNQYRNPLKLYEYCAAGIPSVSTACDFDHLGKKLVNVVDSDEAFVELIGKAMDSDSLMLKESRQVFAKKNTWRIRAEMALNFIKETKL